MFFISKYEICNFIFTHNAISKRLNPKGFTLSKKQGEHKKVGGTATFPNSAVVKGSFASLVDVSPCYLGTFLQRFPFRVIYKIGKVLSA